MYAVLGSQNKEKILTYLSLHSGKKAKEISAEVKISYKLSFKILSEFQEQNIVFKKDNLYYLESAFIEYFKIISESMLKTYTENVFFRNKLDVMNTLLSLNGVESLKENINKQIDNWLMKKLDDWYSKYYDLEKTEEKKLKELIGNNKNTRILEVGSGTGRISQFLNETYTHVVSIDRDKKVIEYSKKKCPSFTFVEADIEEYTSEEKFDLIILGWIGLHYQENKEKILTNINSLLNEKGRVIILDAYYETEYIKILQMIRPTTDLMKVKELKEKLDTLLLEKFDNFNQSIVLNKYSFPSKEEIIENFKIELTLEESHIWVKEDENKLKEYLLTKENTDIGEGLYVTSLSKKSPNE
ncbi:class I SAM-dependent methyltransferase [Candidatus Woesearchaeota archaeon]|nr:class I SAM-dependent methyltransferase [Nanoarchaeota archaeon]MCB9370603.1 class I SAM-dependent methyltransferase [Candidatus Woesearchaeota archaeon]USN43684.1 MAG: class I SAM-dependent methyltransferase [Candidatus Woesearchaeota archaeon]